MNTQRENSAVETMKKASEELRRHLTAKTLCGKCGQFVDACTCHDITVSSDQTVENEVQTPEELARISAASSMDS